MYAQHLGPINWKDRYVTLASQDDYAPQIARPDTSGIVIIVWHQYNGADYNIYAQKIETTHGLPKWSGDGVAVCTATGNQINPRAAYDQSGGVIITWEDYRSGTAEIYAQRLMVSTGVRDQDWTNNGVVVCAISNKPATRPRITGTGDGAFIVWNDARTGLPPYYRTNVYAQYLDADDGSARWTTNGIRVNQDTTINQRNPELVLDRPPQENETPGIIVAWEDMRSDLYQIYAQRVEYTSNILWGNYDVQVAPTRANQLNLQIAQDAAVTSGTPAGPVIVWEDNRNSATYTDVYAQQVDIDGTPLWPTNNGDGLAVSTATNSQLNIRLAYRSDYALIAWEDKRSYSTNGFDVYAGMIDVPGGSILTSSPWSADGRAVCTASGDQINIAVGMYVSQSDAYATIGWQDGRLSSGDDNIYLQQFAVGGSYTYIWQSNGWPVTEAKGIQSLPQISRDVFVYEDGRRGDENIYAQRIGIETDGYTVMSYRDMFAKWTFESAASNHKMVTDDNGNIFVAWQETRAIGATDGPRVFVQKFDSNAVPIWTNNGYLVSGLTYSATEPDIAVGDNGELFVTYLQNGDVVVKKFVDTSGAYWTETISHGSDTFTEPKVVSDGSGGGAIVAYIKNGVSANFHCLQSSNGSWTDSRTVGTYAVNLKLRKDDADGCYAGWERATNDIHLCQVQTGGGGSNSLWTPSNSVQDFDIVLDIFNSTLLCTASADDGTGLYTIYFNRYLGAGGLVGTIPLNVNYDSYSPSIANDGIVGALGNGGAVITWYAYNTTSNKEQIEAQRVTNGNAQFWGAPAPLVISADNNFSSTKPVVDLVSSSYVMIVWEDTRSTGRNQNMSTLFAQLINPASVSTPTLWTTDGIVVSEPAGGNEVKPILRNSFGETLKTRGSGTIFWLDERSDTTCVVGNRKFSDAYGTLGKPISFRESISDRSPEITLDQNFPNPVSRNSTFGTTIRFSLSSDAFVVLKLYDVFGREVENLIEANLPEGNHARTFNSVALPSGSYFYHLIVNGQALTRRMSIVR